MTPAQEKAVADLLRAHVPGLQAVYLFGSMAREETREASDMDLAFLAPEPLGAVQRFDLAQLVAEIVNRPVDLVDLREASTVLRTQVLEQGRRFVCDDTFAADQFEMIALVDYARLNRERAGIISDVRERGTIYGR